MRVLLWSDFHVPFGDEVDRSTASLSAALAPHHELLVIADTVLAVQPGDEVVSTVPSEAGPVTVHRIPMSATLARGDGGGVLALRRSARRLVERFAPEAVLVELTAAAGLLVPLVLGGSEVPVEVRAACAPPADRLPRSLVALMQRCVQWSAPSDRARHQWERLAESAGVSACRFDVCHPLLGLDSPPPMPPPGEGLVVLGRMTSGKGFDVAIAALALLRARGIATTLTLVGDGELRAELQEMVHRVGVADAVRFTGWLPRARAIEAMRAAAVVLVPSSWGEPFGAVAVEAGWCGRAAVVGDDGGLPEAVGFGESGLVVDATSPAAVADAAGRLLTDPELASRLGRAGRARAERHDAAVVTSVLALLDRMRAGSLGIHEP